MNDSILDSVSFLYTVTDVLTYCVVSLIISSLFFTNVFLYYCIYIILIAIDGVEIMSKKTDWEKVIRDTVSQIICAIKTPSPRPKQTNCPNPRARICILILMGITLLFSGIGIYSWIIIIMLFIILTFV